MNAMRILFVCTGNSCRSVMAQHLLQHRLKSLAHRLRGPVEVQSAGVVAIDGMPASRETVRTLQHKGIDVSGHMAQRLTDQMIRDASLILVMEQMHTDEILQRVPEARGKLHLLKAFGVPNQARDENVNIPDPIGKPPEVYEGCLAAIEEAMERVIQSLVGPDNA